jgi:hypothetical protein
MLHTRLRPLCRRNHLHPCFRRFLDCHPGPCPAGSRWTALLILATELVQQRGSSRPIVPQALWTYPSFLPALIAQACFYLAGAGLLTLVQLSMQRALGHTPIESAVLFLPYGVLGGLIGFWRMPKISAHLLVNPRRSTVASLLLVLTGLLLISRASAEYSAATNYLPGMLLLGIGVNCGFRSCSVKPIASCRLASRASRPR